MVAAAAGQGSILTQPKEAGPTRALSKDHARAAVVAPADTAPAADGGAAAAAAAAAGDVSEVVGEHPDYRVLRLASFAVTGERCRAFNRLFSGPTTLPFLHVLCTLRTAAYPQRFIMYVMCWLLLHWKTSPSCMQSLGHGMTPMPFPAQATLAVGSKHMAVAGYSTIYRL
jgi:hypothetical protein